jgi:hypothetical protein
LFAKGPGVQTSVHILTGFHDIGGGLLDDKNLTLLAAGRSYAPNPTGPAFGLPKWISLAGKE